MDRFEYLRSLQEKDAIAKERYLQCPSLFQKKSCRAKNLKNKPCKSEKQIKNQDAKKGNSIGPVKQGTPKLPYLMKIERNIEMKRRITITSQDRFRMRVPVARNQIEQVCIDGKFYVLHEPRFGKPILVIDMDVLKLTHPSALPKTDLPSMLDLLDCLYCIFDIVLWSSLEMCDLIPKLEFFGFFDKQYKFKINMILDKTALIYKYDPVIGPYEVKNLEVIWNIYTQYNEHNCVMVNKRLRRIIYKSYGVPTTREQDESLIDVATMAVIIEYLIGTLFSKYSFSKLNESVAKKLDE